jgi:hypothetical protein
MPMLHDGARSKWPEIWVLLRGGGGEMLQMKSFWLFAAAGRGRETYMVDLKFILKF